MDQIAEAFVYLAKSIEMTAAFAHDAFDAFDAFTYAVKEYMEEKNMEKKCKFKVGDTVINNGCTWYTHTGPGFVGKVVEVMNDGVHMKVKGRSMVAPNTEFDYKSWPVSISAFDLYNPHKGKILIMVDEKDNNKIIARDLLTNKTAEAKCSPKDEWDFNKGAKLALERLTEPEKPKGWTGKVVCVCNNIGDEYGCYHNDDFIVGKVYVVKDGYIISEQHRAYTGITLIESPEQLSWTDTYGRRSSCPYRCKFIEYKGEVTAE